MLPQKSDDGSPPRCRGAHDPPFPTGAAILTMPHPRGQCKRLPRPEARARGPWPPPRTRRTGPRNPGADGARRNSRTRRVHGNPGAARRAESVPERRFIEAAQLVLQGHHLGPRRNPDRENTDSPPGPVPRVFKERRDEPRVRPLERIAEGGAVGLQESKPVGRVFPSGQPAVVVVLLEVVLRIGPTQHGEDDFRRIRRREERQDVRQVEPRPGVVPPAFELLAILLVGGRVRESAPGARPTRMARGAPPGASLLSAARYISGPIRRSRTRSSAPAGRRAGIPWRRVRTRDRCGSCRE